MDLSHLIATFTARAALPLGLLFLLAYNVFILRRVQHQWLLLDLMGLFAVLQLWVVPALRYHLEAMGWTLDPDNNMAVPATVYFPVVIPMVLAFVAGIRMRNVECGMRGPTLRWDDKPTLRWDDKPSQRWEDKVPAMPWILLGLGLVGLLAYPHVPSLLRQPCVLLMDLLWVAAALGLPRYVGMTRFAGMTSSRLAGIASLTVLVYTSITSTFFGTLVLGVVFLAMVYLQGRAVPWKRLLVVQVVAVVLVFYLLSFKHSYRLAVLDADARGPERVGLFFNTSWDALTPPYSWLGVDLALERLNQGMYVSRVLAYVPAQAPYGHGRALGEAFLAAFVPRFLWPHKHRAGGQYNRERFLGVSEATYSYNLGPVGEAWAHFGRWGFVYCFVFAFSLALLQRLLFLFPGMWLFSFYLFAPTLLTEGDSGIVWNHVVKAGIVVVVLALLLPRFLDQHGKARVDFS